MEPGRSEGSGLPPGHANGTLKVFAHLGVITTQAALEAQIQQEAWILRRQLLPLPHQLFAFFIIHSRPSRFRISLQAADFKFQIHGSNG